jgi:hypothetical protein
MTSRFPLPLDPSCDCGATAIQTVVCSSNSKGNAGRAYYFCQSTTHQRKFITWNDNHDISDDNPRCQCGYPTRRHSSPMTGSWFACSAKCCHFKAQISPSSCVAEVDTTSHTWSNPHVEMNTPTSALTKQIASYALHQSAIMNSCLY